MLVWDKPKLKLSSLQPYSYPTSIPLIMLYCFESDRQQNTSDLKYQVTSLWFIFFYCSFPNAVLGSRTLRITYEVGKAAELLYKLHNQNSDCKKHGAKVVQFSPIWRTWRKLLNFNTALERKVVFCLFVCFPFPNGTRKSCVSKDVL